ncbi:MAG: exopolyphosphatase [Eubacteriales bacterium]|nr:exopolyphosphatase [Eubacteriales bacterium]
MQYTVFAAIDIGSYELEMKIFELSRAKGMKEIDCIRHRLEMGTDTYATGKVGNEKVEELCQVLQSFASIMKGYKVSAYRAYATSAIREAKNQIILLDYIEKHTGLKIEVLSNSEQRFLDYKSIASRENEFNTIIQKGTAIVDVGGGSIQISLFDKDSLVTTQNIRIGNLRLRERVSSLEYTYGDVEHLIEEFINSDLSSFRKLYVKDREVKNVIVVGDYIGSLTDSPSVSREEFLEIYDQVVHSPADTAAARFGIPEESVSLVIPSLIIYKRFIELIEAETVWLPGLNLNDGNAYDYALKKNIIRSGHNFDEDILASARNIAKRYQCSKSHIKALEDLALNIFDHTKKLHSLSARERLLLQIAVILHGCGKYISLSDVSDCSYSIIMATEIIGLSHSERKIIANVVKYNTKPFDYYEGMRASLSKEEYLTVAKLTAILRIVNACDRSHKQKFKNVRVALREDELLLTVETDQDITLEKGLFPDKADFFEEVFGVRPVIRQKKGI